MYNSDCRSHRSQNQTETDWHPLSVRHINSGCLAVALFSGLFNIPGGSGASEINHKNLLLISVGRVICGCLAMSPLNTTLAAVLQVAERLRTDPRVVVIDRTNLRYLRLQDLPGEAVPVDLISLDLSFISVLKVMPVVCELLRPGGVLIVLVKPQFEASREQVTHTSLFPMLLESSRS